MAEVLRLNDESSCPDCLKLEREQHELTEIVLGRLAAQDEIIAQQRDDFDGLRDRVQELQQQLLAFADALESASGYVRRQAGLLADLLR